MIDGRSKAAFKTWLAARAPAWREQIEDVAMDGFTDFKTAASEEVPVAVAVMDPFHVVRLAGDALDRCRRRVWQNLHGRRGRKDDPLYRARRTLHTGAGLLTEKQQHRLDALFDVAEHAEVEVTWWIYQRMIAAYRHPDRAKGRELMIKLIDSISHGVPAALVEIVILGRTLKKRAADVLAPTSTDPARPTDRQRRSTAGSSTSPDPHSGSATSPTTSPGACSRPEGSGRNSYTLDRESPFRVSTSGWATEGRRHHR
jgi:transposase